LESARAGIGDSELSRLYRDSSLEAFLCADALLRFQAQGGVVTDQLLDLFFGKEKEGLLRLILGYFEKGALSGDEIKYCLKILKDNPFGLQKLSLDSLIMLRHFFVKNPKATVEAILNDSTIVPIYQNGIGILQPNSQAKELKITGLGGCTALAVALKFEDGRTAVIGAHFDALTLEVADYATSQTDRSFNETHLSLLRLRNRDIMGAFRPNDLHWFISSLKDMDLPAKVSSIEISILTPKSEDSGRLNRAILEGLRPSLKTSFPNITPKVTIHTYSSQGSMTVNKEGQITINAR